jgi:hypothetical protein
MFYTTTTSMSSKFGRWLFLNWPVLYVKTGAAVWLTKAGIDIKNELDNRAKYSHKLGDTEIIEQTAINLAYYSPNVLFWPVNFAIDGYTWGVNKYYERQRKN